MSHCPYVLEEMDSNSELEEYETISYTMVCEELEDIIDGEKCTIEWKMAIQNKENNPAQQDLELHSSVIEVMSKALHLKWKKLSKLTLPSIR